MRNLFQALLLRLSSRFVIRRSADFKELRALTRSRWPLQSGPAGMARDTACSPPGTRNPSVNVPCLARILAGPSCPRYMLSAQDLLRDARSCNQTQRKPCLRVPRQRARFHVLPRLPQSKVCERQRLRRALPSSLVPHGTFLHLGEDRHPRLHYRTGRFLWSRRPTAHRPLRSLLCRVRDPLAASGLSLVRGHFRVLLTHQLSTSGLPPVGSRESSRGRASVPSIKTLLYSLVLSLIRRSAHWVARRLPFRGLPLWRPLSDP